MILFHQLDQPISGISLYIVLILVNSVLALLASSAYAVILVVERSLKMPANPGFIRENEQTVVVSGIGIIYPNIFGFIAIMEQYHPRIALRWQLARYNQLI